MRLLAPLAGRGRGEYWVRATRAGPGPSDSDMAQICMSALSLCAYAPSLRRGARTIPHMALHDYRVLMHAGGGSTTRQRTIDYIPPSVEIIAIGHRRQKHPRFSSACMLQIEVYSKLLRGESGGPVNTQANAQILQKQTGSGIHGYKQLNLTATTADPRKSKRCERRRRSGGLRQSTMHARAREKLNGGERGRESWMLAALRCAPLGRSASAFSSRWRGAARGCGR